MITRYIQTVFVGILLAFLAIPFVSTVSAADGSFTLSPLIIDEKAKARDILKQTAVLTNNTERKVTIYVTANNIDTVEGSQEFEHYSKAEIETSLANWIEIQRSVIELEPGETKRIPYLIQVHLSATAGIYHAKIYFQEGSNRGEAESRIKTWHAIDVNLEVEDDAKERLQLTSFAPDKVFFTGNSASFSYLLENIGNRSVAPRGEVRIFNRRGEEVATLSANEDGTSLLPEATSQLGAVWDAAGKFGRYKAYLDVEYGEKQVGTVNDTIFFWIIPWKQILFLFIGLAVAVTIVGYVAYDRYGFNKKPQLAYADAEPEPMYNTAVQPQARTTVQTQPQVIQPGAPRQAPVQATPVQPKATPVGQAVQLQPRVKPEAARPAGAVVSLKKKQ